MTPDQATAKVRTGARPPMHDPTAAERAIVYRWLAGLFAHEPTVATLRAYRSEDGDALLTALGEIDALTPIAEMIQGWLPNASPNDLRGIARDLSGEFSRFFLGVGGRRSAPPYQSFYDNPNGRLMQQSASAMQNELRQRAAQIAPTFPEPPDHIAVQLAVMAELVESADRAEQAAYLERHLLGWIGEFRDRCAALSRYGFYTHAAVAVVDFINRDIATLKK